MGERDPERVERLSHQDGLVRLRHERILGRPEVPKERGVALRIWWVRPVLGATSTNVKPWR